MSDNNPDANHNADRRAQASNASGEELFDSDSPLSPEDFDAVAEALVSQAGLGAINERLRQLLGDNQALSTLAESTERSRVSLAKIRALLGSNQPLDESVLPPAEPDSRQVTEQIEPNIDLAVNNEREAAAARELQEEEKPGILNEDQSDVDNEDSNTKRTRERRQRYTVKENDTLELISAKMLRDQKLASLIYKINEKKIISFVKQDRLVLDLKPRLVIYLPTSTDIERFRETQPYHEFIPFRYAFQPEPTDIAPVPAEDQPTVPPETTAKRRQKKQPEQEDAEQQTKASTQRPRERRRLAGSVKTNESSPLETMPLENSLLETTPEEKMPEGSEPVVSVLTVAEPQPKESKPRKSKSKESKPKESQTEESQSKQSQSKDSQSKQGNSADSQSEQSKTEESNPKISEPAVAEPQIEDVEPEEGEPSEANLQSEDSEQDSQPIDLEPVLDDAGNGEREDRVIGALKRMRIRPATEELAKPDQPPERETKPDLRQADEYRPRKNVDRGVIPYILRDEGNFELPLGMNCRLLGNSDASDCYEYSLQIMLNGKWETAVSYEIYRDRSFRNELAPDGSKRTIKVDLPPGAVQDLAKNDFSKNWSQYQRSYLSKTKL
jgi:hypothetical protein